MARTRRGFFITLEGPDGSGKSTQMKLLAAHLRRAGVDCVLTREPGGGGKNSLAEKIRSLILASRRPAPTPETELLLIMAARAQHVHDLIRPALRAGRTVLCERFADATYAYQAGGRGLPARWIEQTQAVAAGGLEPDLTLLLDLAPARGLARALAARAGHDRIESESAAFHRRVRAEYLRRARREPERVVVIPADRPPAEVAERVWRIVSGCLAHRRGGRHGLA